MLEREDVQVVVSDEWMPGMRGVELLAQVAKEYPYIVRILLTGDPSSMQRCVRSTKAKFSLSRPACSPATFDSVIREALIRQSRGKLQEDLMRVAGQGIEHLQRIEGFRPGVPLAPASTWAAPESRSTS